MNPRGRREVAFALGAYAAYLLVRRIVWNDRGRARAVQNAARVVALERSIGLDLEPVVRRAALRAPAVVKALNVGYALANVTVSVGWLIVLYRRRDPAFFRERRAALLTFVGALPFFAVRPTAPPRKLEGFVETIAGERTGLDHPFIIRWYNPVAAMPSHHVAFASVTGLGLAARSKTRRGRMAWSAYPAAVAVVVIATANHFVLDVAGGAALGLLARKVTR